LDHPAKAGKIDRTKDPRFIDKMADAVSSQGIDPGYPAFGSDVQVGIGEEVMPLARGGLVIAHEEEELVGLAGIVIELVIGEPDGPVLIDDHLGREEDRVDLGYLFCAEDRKSTRLNSSH